MPITGLHDPGPDLDKLDAGAATLPMSQADRYAAELDPLRVTRQAAHAVTHAPEFFGRALLGSLSSEPGDPLPGDYGYGDINRFIQPEDANARYGVDGYLRFNNPITPDEAAWLNAEAQRRRYKDVVLSSTRPTPLRDFGVSVFGALVDPVGLAVMGATDGIGRAGMAAWELRGATGVAGATAKAGRVWNAAPRLAVQGVAVNAPYVALSAGLTLHAGDDYEMGDALRDIAFGAVVHTGIGLAGRGVKAYLGSSKRRAGTAPPDAEGPPDLGDRVESVAAADVAPAGRMPDAVEALPTDSRLGALHMALDQVIDGEPVAVGDLVKRELEPVTLERLDDPTAAPSVASWRPLEEAVAVTPRGTEVKVRYGLVEMADLNTSHTNDLEVNPTFPSELQPRDRSRAGAQARNHQLESEMNPKLLMRDVSAGGGAPIVSPEGVVESGNGRTIALRRSAANGTEAYQKYLAELEAQGFDTSGMKEPVLVRMRTEPMNGGERAALARELNADVTERMSPAEQAQVDSERLGDALDLIPDNGSLRDPVFTKAVIDRIAPDQIGVFVNKDGRLSKEGERRIRAAVVARAYGDEGLVGQIFEGEETATRKLGDALAEAAPQWAKMRSLAAANQIPEAMDLTPNLMIAVGLVREARTRGVALSDIVAERLGQRELFGGETISPASEAWLRLFFRDEEFKKPRAAEKVTEALRDYARQAGEVVPGPDLFGDIPDEGTARRILANVAAKFASGVDDAVDLRAPGRAASAQPAPVVYDVRKPGPDGGGSGGSGLLDEAQGGAGDQGGRAGAAGGGAESVVPPTPDQAYGEAYHQAVGAGEKPVAEAHARVVELEAQVAKAAKDVVDTRGQGARYHGATGPISKLEEGYYGPANIYGGIETFYTTDAADIAQGYFRKSKTGQLYEVVEREPVRAFDMEQPGDEAFYHELFDLGPDPIGFPASAIEEVLGDNGGRASLRQVMDEIRGSSAGEGVSRDEVQEIFGAATEALKRQGYGAMDHVGGLKTNREPHAVRIYFEAHNQLEVRPVEVPRVGVPAELQAELAAAQDVLGRAERAATEAAEAAGSAAARQAQEAAAAAAKPSPMDFYAADPELKALADDTARMFAENGGTPPMVRPNEDPANLTKGIHAAAVCLTEEGLG